MLTQLGHHNLILCLWIKISRRSSASIIISTLEEVGGIIITIKCFLSPETPQSSWTPWVKRKQWLVSLRGYKCASPVCWLAPGVLWAVTNPPIISPVNPLWERGGCWRKRRRRKAKRGNCNVLRYTSVPFCWAKSLSYCTIFYATTEQHLGHWQEGCHYRGVSMASNSEKTHFCCLCFYLYQVLQRNALDRFRGIF